MRETESELRSRKTEIKKLKISEERDEEIIKEKVELELRVRQLEKELEEVETGRKEVEVKLKTERGRTGALGRELEELKACHTPFYYLSQLICLLLFPR